MNGSGSWKRPTRAGLLVLVMAASAGVLWPIGCRVAPVLVALQILLLGFLLGRRRRRRRRRRAAGRGALDPDTDPGTPRPLMRYPRDH